MSIMIFFSESLLNVYRDELSSLLFHTWHDSSVGFWTGIKPVPGLPGFKSWYQHVTIACHRHICNDSPVQEYNQN